MWMIVGTAAVFFIALSSRTPIRRRLVPILWLVLVGLYVLLETGGKLRDGLDAGTVVIWEVVAYIVLAAMPMLSWITRPRR